MSLPNYLAKIKSSGIYRFVWDKSEVAAMPAETLRLVVGYSEKGPFNTPVYIRTATEFINTYGNINKKLERRGVFFHRLALQALTAGPILALNLKKFNTNPKAKEVVDAISFSPCESMFQPDFINPNVIKLNVEDIYNTNRFWTLEPDMLQKAAGMNNYINLSITDSKDCSNTVFIRGAKVTGYDVTIKSWYSNIGEEVPSYFEDNDGNKYDNMLLSDFWADAYVFKGKFTPEIATSNALARYFDVNDGVVSLKRYVINAFGDKVDTLTALAADPNANFVKMYTGCLLPNFKDAGNKYVSLDLIFNSDNYLHKMMMDFNIEKLDNGDITVNTLSTTGFDKVTVDLMKALIAAVGTKEYENVYDSEGITPITMFSNAKIVPEISVASFADGSWKFVESDYITDPHFYVYKDGDEMINKQADGKKWGILGFAQGDRFLGDEGKISTITKIDYIEKTTDVDTAATADTIGAKVTVAAPVGNGVNGGVESNTIAKNAFAMKFVEAYTAGETTPNYKLTGGVTCSDDIDFTKDIKIVYLAGKKWVPVTLTAEGTFDVTLGSKVMPATDTSLLQVVCDKPGDYTTTFTYTDLEKGTPIVSTKLTFAVGPNTNRDVKYTFDKAPAVIDIDGTKYVAKCNMTISHDASTIYPIYFEGYTYANPKPKTMKQLDKLNWQEKIMSTLTDYRGLRTALTSRTDVDYRYIVDTFEAYVDTEVHAKLAIIAKEKDNALAFLNFPSVKTFSDCDYTSFTDENGRFQVKYIGEGGNKLKNPAKLFTLVSEPNGASFASYNTPLTFSDGTVKTYVPSAALVSNNFMTKYTSRQPYYIVAGPNYGRMIYDGMVGPDYNYSREDLDILEPMGVNAMVYVPRKGTYINSNQTAKQNPVTALSKINIRELVIYLQDEIEKLLQNYQWEFNTQALRDLIKSKADVICENVKANGGLYAYINICDTTNNTNDVIDNEMLVLSTEIEPGRGAGKMVQELTIHRTGGLTASVK